MTQGEDKETLEALAMADTSNPEVRMRILAYRVSVLVREKEDIELRLAKMEKVYNMGAGILWTIPFVAGAFGFLVSYWKLIFSPWYVK